MIFIVFSYTFQMFRKIFCEIKKLSYMNELMYTLVTLSDWSMALKETKIASSAGKNVY